MNKKAAWVASLLLFGLSSAATAAATDDGCIVEANRKALAKHNSASISEIYKLIYDHDPIKSGELENDACLPALSQLGIDGSLSLPSLSGLLSGLLNRIKDYACTAMNSYAQQQVDALSVAISDPVGLTHTGVAVTNKDGSVSFGTTEGVDVGQAIADPVFDVVKGQIDGQVKTLPRAGDALSRINRGQAYEGALSDNVAKELEGLRGGSRR